MLSLHGLQGGLHHFPAGAGAVAAFRQHTAEGTATGLAAVEAQHMAGDGGERRALFGTLAFDVGLQAPQRLLAATGQTVQTSPALPLWVQTWAESLEQLSAAARRG